MPDIQAWLIHGVSLDIEEIEKVSLQPETNRTNDVFSNSIIIEILGCLRALAC